MSLHMLGAAPLAPRGGVVVSVTVSPPSPSVEMGKTQQFSAVATDAQGNAFAPPIVSWSAVGSGTIDPSGMFTPTGPGTCTITARVGTVSGQTVVTITSTAPTGTTKAPSLDDKEDEEYPEAETKDDIQFPRQGFPSFRASPMEIDPQPRVLRSMLDHYPDMHDLEHRPWGVNAPEDAAFDWAGITETMEVEDEEGIDFVGAARPQARSSYAGPGSYVVASPSKVTVNPVNAMSFSSSSITRVVVTTSLPPWVPQWQPTGHVWDNPVKVAVFLKDGTRRDFSSVQEVVVLDGSMSTTMVGHGGGGGGHGGGGHGHGGGGGRFRGGWGGGWGPYFYDPLAWDPVEIDEPDLDLDADAIADLVAEKIVQKGTLSPAAASSVGCLHMLGAGGLPVFSDLKPYFLTEYPTSGDQLAALYAGYLRAFDGLVDNIHSVWHPISTASVLLSLQAAREVIASAWATGGVDAIVAVQMLAGIIGWFNANYVDVDGNVKWDALNQPVNAGVIQGAQTAAQAVVDTAKKAGKLAGDVLQKGEDALSTAWWTTALLALGGLIIVGLLGWRLLGSESGRAMVAKYLPAKR